MAVSETYRTFVLEQLESVVPDVHARRMFGGVGIYSGEHFFALISQDALYFKVDDLTRPSYEEAGCLPFRPYGEMQSMNYFSVPADVLEDGDRLAEWAGEALSAARRSKQR